MKLIDELRIRARSQQAQTARQLITDITNRLVQHVVAGNPGPYQYNPGTTGHAVEQDILNYFEDQGLTISVQNHIYTIEIPTV